MIEVKNLVKKYGKHIAVDHLSFTVDKGEVLGFLGPNGAGKSTTMNMLTGYISATEGSITINGHDIFEEPEEVKKCIGYLPEQPPVYMDMTVSEYLSFVGELKKVPAKKIPQQMEEVMKKMDIADVKDRLIKHLSKGYRQRIGLAQALIGNPEVLILDEPTVGLDPAQIIEIRDLIKKLAKDHTIILSSHILTEVSAICDKVMIINQGKLVIMDKPQLLSTHLKSSNELNLTVKANKEALKTVLKQMNGITNVSYESAGNGLLKTNICCKPEEDIREALFYALAEKRMPIYEMKRKSLTLEQIFLELTQKEPQEAMKAVLETQEEEKKEEQRDESSL